jgi:hypothetical protein
MAFWRPAERRFLLVLEERDRGFTKPRAGGSHFITWQLYRLAASGSRERLHALQFYRRRTPVFPSMLCLVNDYWRAANYLTGLRRLSGQHLSVIPGDPLIPRRDPSVRSRASGFP